MGRDLATKYSRVCTDLPTGEADAQMKSELLKMADIPVGATVAAFGLTLEMEDVLLTAEYQRRQRSQEHYRQ